MKIVGSDDWMKVPNDAQFSDCGRYRYLLSRDVDPMGELALFIGLNPSKADARNNDPTIRRMRCFAGSMGLGLLVVNLYAMVATEPDDLYSSTNRVGAFNDEWILQAAALSKVRIACWGAHALARRRVDSVSKLLDGYELKCFGRNADGSPRHPLYLPKTSQLEDFHVN